MFWLNEIRFVWIILLIFCIMQAESNAAADQRRQENFREDHRMLVLFHLLVIIAELLY